MTRYLFLVLAGLMLLSGCECEYVRAGYVGVKVYTMGSSKGDLEKVGVGRYFLGPNEDLYIFPMFVQSATWVAPRTPTDVDESISFQTSDNMIIRADVGITYHVEEDKVLDLFTSYRRPIEEITDTFLRNQVKDAMNMAASSLTVEVIASDGKVKFMETVKADVAKRVISLGIVVEDIYLLTALRLPKQIEESINNKNAATQRAQQKENELRESEAEAKKVVAKARGEAEAILATAEAQAKANELLSKSLTAPLVQMKAIEKWNGIMPQVTGPTTPFLTLPQAQ
jgi:regulator of protease activity HflC (stomatin/prohibitin superfamily)